MFVFLLRAIKFSWQSFFRNIWLSIVTIIILVLTLLSVTTVVGVNFVAERAIESVKDKVDVSIYFKTDVDEDKVTNVRYRLEELSQVKEVTYVSKEEALRKFKDRHVDDEILLESLNQLEDNPLSSTLIIKANNIEDYDRILAVLDNPDYDDLIQDKSFEDNEKVISQLSNISERIERIGIGVSAVFIVIAILIVFNTIRINIYTHREEIGIMKLVGATNWFVRAPFLFESLLYAVLAVFIGIAILYPMMGVISPQVNIFFEGYNLDLASYFSENLLKIIGWQLLVAVLLSIISSSIAIGKYLRV